MVRSVSRQKDAPVPVEKRRFTVDEYHRMVETGILSEDDRVELIEGEVVKMTPMGARHAACVDRLVNRLVGRNVIVRAQSPIVLDNGSEPEPDISLLKPREDFYSDAHPTPADVLLVIEVAETSIEYDSGIKLPLYAQAGIREAWLVDLPGETIEVHARPATSEYREIVRAKRGETVVSRTVPGLEMAVDAILG